MSDTSRGQWTSASSAQADLLCPGRFLAQRGLPEVESDDATFGTEIHAALSSGDDSKLSPEQQSIAEASRKIEAEKVAEVFGDDSPVFVREKRFWLKSKHWMHSGQPDVVYLSDAKALILEYKTLPGTVPTSERNEQLRDQAVLIGAEYMLNEIAVGVVQPLVTHDCKLCAYDKNALIESHRRLVARVSASNNPASQRIAGELQCKFCRAKTNCREYQSFAGSLLPQTQSLLNVPAAQWTSEQCVQFWDGKAIATKWLETCEDEIRRRLEADANSIPGLQLVPGDIRHPIVQPEVLHMRFIASGGTTGQFMKCVKLGKKELTAQVREATGLKGNELYAKLDELLSGLTAEKPDRNGIKRVTT